MSRDPAACLGMMECCFRSHAYTLPDPLQATITAMLPSMIGASGQQGKSNGSLLLDTYIHDKHIEDLYYVHNVLYIDMHIKHVQVPLPFAICKSQHTHTHLCIACQYTKKLHANKCAISTACTHLCRVSQCTTHFCTVCQYTTNLCPVSQYTAKLHAENHACLACR